MKKLSFTFHTLVFLYGILLIAVSCLPVRAQSAEELSHRIAALEVLNLDHRLTVIETLLNDDAMWHKFTMGGTGMLIMERVVYVIKRKKGEV